MRKLLRFFSISILTLFLFTLSFASGTHAETVDFLHDINATYNITAEKNTHVEYIFTTTNKIDNNYLQKFSFKLPFEPKNITTEGSPTPVKILESKKLPVKNLFQLAIEILEPHYGLNKSFNWKISFDLDNFIFDYGKQKAVIIPSFQDEVNISSFNVAVNIPNSYGDQTFYGNADVVKEGERTKYNYSSKNNKASNFLFILGKDQEYDLEVSSTSHDISLPLPEINPYQAVVYTSFPERTILIDSNQEKNVLLQKNESIKGVIYAGVGNDKLYDKTVSSITNESLVNDILTRVQVDPANKTQAARNIFNFLNDYFTMTDYLTSAQTTVDLKIEKKTINPAELNKVFRETLSKLNIENRGVYGYVFPTQLDAKDDSTAQVHVWSEFWDGEKWISADPTWYISSKGTDYFNKNAFHHIKFGNYDSFEDIKTFFSITNQIRISPRKEDSPQKNLDLSLAAYNDTYLSKEFRLVLTNKSNQPIFIDTLSPKIGLRKVKFKDKEIQINKILYPNSKIDLTLPLQYSFQPLSKQAIVSSTIAFSTLDGEKNTNEVKVPITIKSNISSYLILVILVGMMLLGSLSVGYVILYRFSKPAFLFRQKK